MGCLHGAASRGNSRPISKMIKSPIVESLIECVCPSPRRYVQRLVRLHGLKDGLDIGCGESSLLTPLRSQGFRSAGIDGSPEMLASARERNLHDDYILADFRTHKFDRPFDVVVLSHVIEHFTRDEGLEALRRIEGLARHLICATSRVGLHTISRAVAILCSALE